MPEHERLSQRIDHLKVRAATGQRVHRSELNDLAASASDLEVENAFMKARLQVRSEPLIYRQGGDYSWFYDVARAEHQNDDAAKQRLARHQREMAAEMPRRQESRARATRQYEEAFASDPAGYDALSRMTAAGISPFERRALSRSDGQGGYFSPPMYLIDRYVPFAREASPFASAWQAMTLPEHIGEINVPRLALGAAVGPEPDLQPTPTRDIQDSLVTCVVRTIAGRADASLQWLEQGSGSGGYSVDEMVFADLTADLATNIDGQALLGTGGSYQQLLGVWPGGAIAAANGIIVADSNNATGQTWTVASAGATLHVQLAQLVSLSRRLRARGDGWAWYWHPWTWSLYTAQVDAQSRPLVAEQTLAGLPPGAVGYYQNIPVFLDSNIPTTFGGSVAPSIGAISNGQYAAVPGSGTGASYTPLLLARPKDLYMFAGDVRMQTFKEALSGTAQVRFQLFQYLAALPNRFVAAAATGTSVSAGGDVAHATLTWQQTNSLLILSGSGY